MDFQFWVGWGLGGRGHLLSKTGVCCQEPGTPTSFQTQFMIETPFQTKVRQTQHIPHRQTIYAHLLSQLTYNVRRIYLHINNIKYNKTHTISSLTKVFSNNSFLYGKSFKYTPNLPHKSPLTVSKSVCMFFFLLINSATFNPVLFILNNYIFSLLMGPFLDILHIIGSKTPG